MNDGNGAAGTDYDVDEAMDAIGAEADRSETETVLIRHIAEAEAEIATLKEQVLRAMAETENVRRRAAKEAQDARLYGVDKIARDLLGVADSLASAVSAVPADVKDTLEGPLKGVVDGIAMTEKALHDALARHNVKPFGLAGDKFDPNLHQAVAQIPSGEPAGTLAQVFQTGWVIADRTLRAAMVAVSLGPQTAAAPQVEAETPPGSIADLKA